MLIEFVMDIFRSWGSFGDISRDTNVGTFRKLRCELSEFFHVKILGKLVFSWQYVRRGTDGKSNEL